MYYITFQQIEAFLTTARLQNISLAAEKLNISQPTLSKMLQRFESGIGYSVFKRSNHGITLTPQGSYLLDTFDSVYTNIEAAIRKAKDYDSTDNKQLNINVPITYDLNPVYEVPKKLIAKYMEDYPNVTVTERLYDFDAFLQQLEFGSADVSFTHEFIAASIPNMKYRHIARLPMFIAIPQDHPLAVYDTLPSDKLGQYDFFSIRYVGQTEDGLIKQCREYGFTPKNAVLLDNFQTWLHVMCEKQGVSICAKSNDVASLALKFYPIPMTYHIVAAWHPDRVSKQLSDFFDLLDQEHIEE